VKLKVATQPQIHQSHPHHSLLEHLEHQGQRATGDRTGQSNARARKTGGYD